MKTKSFIWVIATTVLIGLTACSGNTKTENTNSESETTEIMEKAGAQWDVIMDETEALLKDLMKIAPKVAEGEESLIPEYSKKYSKLVDYIQKLDSCKTEMTEAQQQRLTNILKKITEDEEGEKVE